MLIQNTTCRCKYVVVNCPDSKPGCTTPTLSIMKLVPQMVPIATALFCGLVSVSAIHGVLFVGLVVPVSFFLWHRVFVFVAGFFLGVGLLAKNVYHILSLWTLLATKAWGPSEMVIVSRGFQPLCFVRNMYCNCPMGNSVCSITKKYHEFPNKNYVIAVGWFDPILSTTPPRRVKINAVGGIRCFQRLCSQPRLKSRSFSAQTWSAGNPRWEAYGRNEQMHSQPV